MSDFISLFDVAFGVRNANVKGGWSIQRANLAHIASTVEQNGLFCFDEYGRFKKANELEVKQALNALAEYGRMRFHMAGLDEQCAEQVSGPNAQREWHLYGWMSDKLPEFENFHKAWLKTNGEEEHEQPTQEELIDKRVDAKEYMVLAGYLKKSMSPEDYENFINAKAPEKKIARKLFEDLVDDVGESIAGNTISAMLDIVREAGFMYKIRKLKK